MDQTNITLGTAGHIDHGKTALVKCLTGCDTDRLKEEKERGMSIDLGFAPCKIADTQVGIVDVPGHENFIKTMVAGASGMDGVILVVAADDGIMPQTREHLDILTLLGIRHGIVALTKIDRVDPPHRENVRAQLASYLRGTFLENAPILPLSNITGEGFDAFLESLWDLVRSIQPKRTDGVFRLPLDRAFSVQGYGTVIAGIPTAGAARVGDEVVLLPQNIAGRIRRIEVYGKTNDAVLAGQCAAINVGHWDSRDIGRGDVLTVPGFFTPQSWFVGSLRLLPREKLLLKSGAEVRFHAGTSDVAAMFYPLKGNQMAGGEEALVQIRTKKPVVAGPGDFFLLRTPSPVRTIGGGRIVEAVSQRLKGSRPQVYEDLEQRAAAAFEEHRFVEYCVRKAESTAIEDAAVAVRAKIPLGRVQEILAQLVAEGKIFPLTSRLYMHRDTATELERQIEDHVEQYHRQSPESPGIASEQLRQAIPQDRTIIDGLVERLKAEGRLVERSRRWASPSHRPALEDQDAKLRDAVETLFRESLFSPPNREELVQRTGAPVAKINKILSILQEHQVMIQVEQDFLFHQDAIARAREILAEHFRKENRLESVQFKYLLDTTRKFALPLLDYMDRIGVTRRSGNTRFPKEPRGTANP